MGDADERPVAAHLFVADLDDPVLDDGDRHHVERVLRLRPGEVVSLSDGAGGWRTARLGDGGSLDVGSELRRDPRPAFPVTVGFALVKADRSDWVVQKLTECGVDRIVPFTASRSVVRWDADKAARRVERWRAIAREAAMQSRRSWLPEIAGVTGFEEALASVGGTIADAGGVALDAPLGGTLVGPEGGWADTERTAATKRVALGSHVLRAETAAVAAGVLLCALREGIVGPRPGG